MRNRVAVVALSAILAAVLAGFALAATTSVGVRNTSLGKIIVTGKGRTLYMFAPDKNGRSTCYGTCAKYWPPLMTTTEHITALAGVKASLLGTTKRRNGKLEVTYNHHPLYLYIADTKAGQTTGQGLNLNGGLWWVLSPAGAIIKKKSSGGASYP